MTTQNNRSSCSTEISRRNVLTATLEIRRTITFIELRNIWPMSIPVYKAQSKLLMSEVAFNVTHVLSGCESFCML
jgi:hypothetical protein